MNPSLFEVKIHKMGAGYIQTKYLDPKTGKRKRKRFNTLREAKEYKRAVESKVTSKGANAFSDLRISQAMKEHLDKTPDSRVISRRNHFVSFIEKFGIYRINEITSGDLQNWMNESREKENLSTLTLNHVKSQFNTFFKFLKDEKYINQNPMDGVFFKKFDTPRRKRVILSIDEVRQILADAKKFSPNILYPYLSTVAHTGARRGEVTKLNTGDIDFSTGLIHLRETKNSHERFVRISPMLEEALRDQIKSHNQTPLIINNEGERIHRSQVTRLMNKFKAYFPIENKPNWGSHSLRHSFAYNFLKRSGKMYQLQAILGHKSIDVTVDLYGQLQAQDVDCPSPYEPIQEKTR